jgi:hypothetical protein
MRNERIQWVDVMERQWNNPRFIAYLIALAERTEAVLGALATHATAFRAKHWNGEVNAVWTAEETALEGALADANSLLSLMRQWRRRFSTGEDGDQGCPEDGGEE